MAIAALRKGLYIFNYQFIRNVIHMVYTIKKVVWVLSLIVGIHSIRMHQSLRISVITLTLSLADIFFFRVYEINS